MSAKVYSFADQLAYSRGVREGTDIETLHRLFRLDAVVRKTDERTDRQGVDYVVQLRGGGEVLVDAKARKAGCSYFWADGPELAMEIWSAMPGGKYDTERSKVGWTLNESTPVDYILFTFDPADCEEVFLLPFQLLRLAFRGHAKRWMQTYKVDIQDSGSWESQAVFVPVPIVMDAIERAGRTVLKRTAVMA